MTRATTEESENEAQPEDDESEVVSVFLVSCFLTVIMFNLFIMFNFM